MMCLQRDAHIEARHNGIESEMRFVRLHPFPGLLFALGFGGCVDSHGFFLVGDTLVPCGFDGCVIPAIW